MKKWEWVLLIFDEIINNFPNCETVLYAKV